MNAKLSSIQVGYPNRPTIVLIEVMKTRSIFLFCSNISKQSFHRTLWIDLEKQKQNEIGIANTALKIRFIVELDNKFLEVVYPYSAGLV